MPANPVPIDVKTKGQTWLLPPYNWSHRRIAKELDVSPSVVAYFGASRPPISVLIDHQIRF